MRLPLPVLALAAICMTAGPAAAAGIAVRDAWTRETIQGTDGAAIYLTVVNSGAAPDALVGLSTPIAGDIRLHTTGTTPGVMSMQEVASIPIPAKSTVRLQPMGMHAMVAGLKHPLKVGQTFPLSVRFEHAGVQTVRVHVRGMASMPAHAPSMPGMPGM